MKLKLALLIAIMLTTAAAHAILPPNYYAVIWTSTVTGTNDAGRITTTPFSSRAFVALTREAFDFSSRGMALTYDQAHDSVQVINVTNQHVLLSFFYFQPRPGTVQNAAGTQRKRFVDVLLWDGTPVGTAVLSETMTFNGPTMSSYHLTATLQIMLPGDDDVAFGADRPILMTGKFTTGKKL